MNGVKKTAADRPAVLLNHYPQLATTLDLAAEMIETHGWYADGARYLPVGSTRPLTALTAIGRAAHANVGDGPFLFHHVEEAVAVVEATLGLDADSLTEWNDTRSSSEVVTDALRLCATRLRLG